MYKMHTMGQQIADVLQQAQLTMENHNYEPKSGGGGGGGGEELSDKLV